jgi:2-keto-myo-inositol isomerase
MARPQPQFALNHIIAPPLGPEAFFALAVDLGLGAVEIRNDLEGNAILDGTPPGTIRRLAEAAGVRILTINALQRFDDWRGRRPSEAETLADYAQACGAEAVVLVPCNDGTDPERLLPALEGLRAILAARGLTGLVEPLGFETCSLRLKSAAVAAIDAIDGAATFRLVHDTFHHALAGEDRVFPERTGLVHLSGVDDPRPALAALCDGDRGLVTAQDRLGNIAQVGALIAGGYGGPLSFEPFSPQVQALDDAAPAIRRSIDLVREGLSVAAV